MPANCCGPAASGLLQAYSSAIMMANARDSHEEFCIPVCVLPATISNNVPGTDISIGSDTGLDAVVEVRELCPLLLCCVCFNNLILLP